MLLLVMTPSFGKDIVEVTSSMGFSVKENKFVPMPGSRLADADKAVLAGANETVRGLVEFAGRTGNSPVIKLDTAKFGRKLEDVKLFSGTVEAGGKVEIPVKASGALIKIRARLRLASSAVDYPSPVENLYMVGPVVEGEKTRNFSGLVDSVSFSVPVKEGRKIELVFFGGSVFEGTAEKWVCDYDVFLMASVENRAEVIYSIVDLVEENGGYNYVLTVSEEQAVAKGLTGDEYKQLAKRVEQANANEFFRQKSVDSSNHRFKEEWDKWKSDLYFDNLMKGFDNRLKNFK